MKDDLIINENVLLPEFLPERLPGREKEIDEIAYNFRLALNGRKPENLLIYGPPGTGKTAVLKYVISKLEEFSSKVRIVYINCWNTSTRYGILWEVARNVGYVSPPRGCAVEDLISRIVEIVKKRGIFLIVVLDELDRLVAGGHSDVLYDLSRMNEGYGAKVGVVGVVNDLGLITNLDPRIRSSLINKDVEFKPYSAPVLKEILLERAKVAFSKFDEEAIGLVAAHAYKNNGDARLGISLLLSAGRIAEKKGLSTLNVECAKEAISQKSFIPKNEKSEVVLDDVEKRIVSILKEKGEVRSGELYQMMKDVNERTLRNHLEKLIESGIVEITEVKGRGKTRIIRLVENPQNIKS